MSRLLTILLLYQSGYEVGRFISLEKIIENSKEDYYRVLKESSSGWHEQSYHLMPWWNYFLSMVKTGYQDLKTRVEFVGQTDTASSLIKQTVLNMLGSFQISDIQKIHPNVDRELIKKVFYNLKAEKLIKLSGKGRGARWSAV